MLEIRYDNDKIKRLERELRGFPKNSLPKVMSRALNRTATQARTRFVKFGAERYGWPQKYIRPWVLIKKATYNNWLSRVSIRSGSWQGVPTKFLKPKQTNIGVKYKNPISGSRTTLKHAFIATMESGHKGVFTRADWYLMERSWAKNKYGTIFKKAIYEEHVVGLDTLIEKHNIGVLRSITEETSSSLQKNIHDQVQLILKRRLPA